jgi:hypothetical protein
MLHVPHFSVMRLLRSFPTRAHMRTRKNPPQRSDGQTQICVSLPEAVRDAADRRAKSLGLSRSNYITQLIRAEAGRDDVLVLTPSPLPDGRSTKKGSREKRS